MNCDGLHSLACIKPIDQDLSKPSLITPLGHMFVLKDLVVDMTNFYTQYKTIEPFLKRKTPKVLIKSLISFVYKIIRLQVKKNIIKVWMTERS